MLEERFIISDRQWALMEPHCLGKKTDPGRDRRGWAVVFGGGSVDCPHR